MMHAVFEGCPSEARVLDDPMPPHLSELAISFLLASHELVTRQQELLSELAATLGVGPEEVFYSWMERSFPRVGVPPGEDWRLQVGLIEGTDWDYFFHGFECDLRHRSDGRFVRVEFGPQGRVDTFSGYAVLQFVMTSKCPWSEYHDLKTHLAEKDPPHDEYSGSHSRMCALWDRIEQCGFVEPAAPELCALVEAHRLTLPSGSQQIRLPKDLPRRLALDCMVCYRSVLSPLALRLLTEMSASSPDQQ